MSTHSKAAISQHLQRKKDDGFVQVWTVVPGAHVLDTGHLGVASEEAFSSFFVAHSWQCPGLASGSVLREDSLRGLKGPFVVSEIKGMSASCKTSALPPMLTLQPPKIVFCFIVWGAHQGLLSARQAPSPLCCRSGPKFFCLFFSFWAIFGRVQGLFLVLYSMITPGGV